MASLAKTRAENHDGSLFVDSSCINCGTCRIVADKFFGEINSQSAVVRQPTEADEWISANQAIIACPVNAIGTKKKQPLALQIALRSFPQLIEDGVYYCEYAARESYGASSYLILRKNGNVLVDSPRFNQHLIRKIDGEAPIAIAEDLLAIPTPGHTKGHTVLLYKNKFLFSGDHLAYSPKNKSLYAFDGSCWYSWNSQIKSVNILKNLSFEWILPGHGNRGRIKNSARLIEKCILEMNQL